MMRCGKSPWTPEIEQALFRLTATDLPFPVITDRLNDMFSTAFTINAVIGRFHRLGGTRNGVDYWTDAAVDMLKRLQAEGRPAEAIASALTAQFGRCYSPGRINAQLTRLGLPRAGKARRRLKKPPAPAKLSNVPQSACEAMLQIPSAVVVPIRKTAAPANIANAQEPITVSPVTLLDRDQNQCCWPVDDGPPFLFCGAIRRQPRDPDDTRFRGYCDHHFARLLQKRRMRRINGAQP